MAYIYPNSELYILTGVFLNHDYDHTIFFTRQDFQFSYFSQKFKYHLTNQQYQRKERGYLQVNIPQSDLLDCTYIMFNNPRNGNNKWYYAFINSVNYVNENVSIINFQIDVIQTWFFDYTLDKCFVEREHTETDGMFENTIDEGIDTGDEYYNSQIATRWLFDATRVGVIYTGVPTGQGLIGTKPTLQGNVFSGLGYTSFDLLDDSSRDSLEELINEYISTGEEDGVIAIFQYPRFIGRLTAPTVDPSTHEIIQPGSSYEYADRTFSPNFVNADGYVPKNKKLFCFPYNYLSVSDKEGNGTNYKWELWNDSHRGEFRIEGCAFGKPTVQIIPKYYRDVGFELDYESGLTYSNFPICAWSGDSYQVWLAQHQHQMNAEILTAIGKGATKALRAQTLRGMPINFTTLMMSGITVPNNWYEYHKDVADVNTLDALVDVASSIGKVIAEKNDAKNLPNKYHGDLNSDILNIQNGSSGWELKQMTIKSEYAKIIDEYFSRYGYACHRIKVPNRNARQKWTYTKTVGCEITGNIPSDDAKIIKEIYDHGITFWNNGDGIGNYGDFTNPTYS